MNRKQKKMLARIIVAAVMLIALNFIPVTGAVSYTHLTLPTNSRV